VREALVPHKPDFVEFDATVEPVQKLAKKTLSMSKVAREWFSYYWIHHEIKTKIPTQQAS
jgi:hypothetical protein